MARQPVITRGPRGLEDRGKPNSSGNPQTLDQILDAKPGAPHAANEKHFVTLQASRSGRIVQLTAPADRENRETGVRIRAQPLTLNFATGSGFLRLDMRLERDRRKWIRVVGTEQAEKDFDRIGVTHKPNPEDGTDPIDPHVRYRVGHPMGFWNVADSSRVAAKARRSAVLDQVASDPEMAKFLRSVTPQQLDEIIAKRKAKLSARQALPVGAPEHKSDAEMEADADVGVDL